MKKIDLTSSKFGTKLTDSGFYKINARRYIRLTEGNVVQRIEMRPNSRGGEITCDLTIHPLWAREKLNLQVLEPGISLRSLIEFYNGSVDFWYPRTEDGVQLMINHLSNAGLKWFEETSTAEGIVKSSKNLNDPWANKEFIHVELGHSYLEIGELKEAQKIFDRKPKRVPKYKTLTKWITNSDFQEIKQLHEVRIKNSKQELSTIK